MTEQPLAMKLADQLDRYLLEPCEHAAELRRLSQHEATLKEFLEKTEWVQATAKPGELGKHRADVLRDRIAALEAENASLRAMFKFDNEGGHGWWTATLPSDHYNRNAAIDAALKETP